MSERGESKEAGQQRLGNKEFIIDKVKISGYVWIDIK